MEIIEKVVAPAEKKEYASKGVAGTALGLGIAGTALWALNGGLGNGGGLFGGNNSGIGSPTYTQTEIDVLAAKQCQDAIDLTKAIYDQRILSMNERFSDRQTINQEMFGIYKSQIDADFNLYKNQRDSFDILKNEIGDLKCQVAVGAAIRPYQDKLIQCEIDKAFTAGVNYTDRKTCRMITGEVVLPNHPVVTGYGSYPAPCACTSVVSTPSAL